MPMKDGFDPDHSLPRFLAEPQFLADQAEQDIGHAPGGVGPASRAVKASILIATAAAIGIAVLATGDPLALFAEGTASLIDNSSPQSTPTIQSAADAPASVVSTADVQALPQTTNDAPSRSEIAAPEPPGKDQAENREPASETLFRQFQAWAAEQDAQARGAPAQPVQDAPAEVVQAPAQAVQAPPQDVQQPAQDMQDNPVAPAAQNVRTPHRLVHKRRHERSVRDARAEMRMQNHRVRRQHVRRAQSERAEGQPIQDVRTQDQSMQSAQPPSWLPSFGLGN
jgi:hypothetical protein